MPANEKTANPRITALLTPFVFLLKVFFVIPHEICHYIPAWLLGLNPDWLITDEGGRVRTDAGTKKQDLIVGLSPLIVGIVACVLIYGTLPASLTHSHIVRFTLFMWIGICYYDIVLALQIIRE